MTLDEVCSDAEARLKTLIDDFQRKLLRSGPNNKSPFIADYPVDSWVRKMNAADELAHHLEINSPYVYEKLEAYRKEAKRCSK